MLTRQTLTRLGLAVSIAVTWLVVILRIQPWPFSDYLVFLAVARRLHAGDVLYEGVWDNKDPFVYYSIALVQDLGQPALWALEAAWFVIAAFSAYLIARHFALSRHWSLFIGAVLVPIVLIPFHYFPGTTHLPGVSLSLLALATFLGKRYALSGIALGLLFFFKLTMLPIPLIAIAVIALRHRRPRTLMPVGLGSVITVGIGAVVIAVRGEFVPYLGSLLHNFIYSQTNTQSGATGIAASVTERLAVFSDTHVLITIVVIVAVLAVTYTRVRTNDAWVLTATTFALGLLSIAAIGKFPHHAQVLGVAAALALVTVAIAFRHARQQRPFVTATALILIAIGLTGGPYVKGYVDALRNPQGTWNAMTTIDPATQDLLDSGPPRSFAVVQGAGMPRSPGLEDWDLVCRHLAQRPWESAELLQESLDCFPTADVLLIPRDFAVSPKPPAYRRFLQGVQTLLNEEYVCTPGIANTVCTRRDNLEND